MPWQLLETQPTKMRWKNQVRTKVNQYWCETIKSRAAMYSTLEHLNYEIYRPGVRPTVIHDPNGVKDVPRIHTKLKLLTGSYVLQVNRAAFSQNQISPTCLLCLENTRQPILEDIRKAGESWDNTSSADHLQCILDPTVVLSKSNSSEIKYMERQARRLCHALHIERFRQLPQTVTKRKRSKGKKKPQCKPAGTV